ncbi:Ubiquinone biosynthesis accessory factor UbiK [Halomonadaceae bacterium LMG 33818]|uniref:accessory factor UbiK family protein n=1 Tax=Cernens ardua TaxID=3402176 RepID=UPI003EDB9E86
MSNNEIFGRIAQHLGDRLSNVSQAPEEIQKTVQGAMKGAFDRLDLVSREDFDIMMDVLTRTRARVEALEKRLAELEEKLPAEELANK